MLCFGRRMHPVSFQLKRGHLSAVRVGRGIFMGAKVADMTPARFDILFLIHNHLPKWISVLTGFSVEQREIKRRLGLSAPTISRMLKRLTQLGLVTRGRTGSDARRKVVTLTEEGVRRIRQAIQAVFGGQHLKRLYEQFVVKRMPRGSRRYRRRRIVDAVFSLFAQILAVGRHLGNTSSEVYGLNYEPDH